MQRRFPGEQIYTGAVRKQRPRCLLPCTPDLIKNMANLHTLLRSEIGTHLAAEVG